MGCPQCGWVHWNNPTPVVAAIVQRGEAVVLVRSHGWPETWYGLVTGFLEAGEEVEAAVLREVKEETGLDGQLGEFIGAYSFFRRNQIILAWHVIVPAEGVIVLDTNELAGYRCVPITE
ncbi:MAG: NUDIX hydrolase, partial [Bacteroidetes bacterium]